VPDDAVRLVAVAPTPADESGECAEEDKVGMDPFRDYQQAMPAAARCRRSARCAVCSGRPAQLRVQFSAIVRLAWSPAEIDLLTKAARAALL
jgi:hypothetical protein